MLAYILDHQTLKIKDLLEFEDYEFREDIEYAEKSFITVARKPEIEEDDFVFCKDNNQKVFIGICETFGSGSDKANYQISLLQKENLFDREIFVEHEELIAQSGIEDFIVKAIEDNFITSGDSQMDKSYLSVSADTHTPIAAKVEAENGVYNLKTHLGNAKQYYGIFLEFSFSTRLEIRIRKKDEPPIPIDIEVTDISDYTETYSVSVLAKLLVNWKVPDSQDEAGNPVIGPLTRRIFYLLSDRTITEDRENEDRAAGTVKSMYIESQTEEEMLQQVYNAFMGNQYSHKVSFSLIKSSRLYPVERFFVGRTCTIKTKSGVRTSIVTKAEIRSNSSMIGLTFGKLKVTLIEKLRRQKW